MNTGKYDRQLSRQYPGLFVILLDQSASMEEIVAGSNETKASIATSHVNAIIQKMIDFAGVDEYTGNRKNYAYLSVLGYNDDVYPLLSTLDTPVDIPTLDENPRGVASVTNVVKNQFGKVVRTFVENRVFWVEPKAEGNTQMAFAFERAKKIIEDWLNSAPELISQELGSQMPRNKSFPPVIINITDAKHNGEGKPDEVAEEIRALQTENGNVLLCNCHFTHKQWQPYIFPKDISELEQLNTSKLAKQMFAMSSVIPEQLRQRATKIMRTPIEPGARCFVYNADPDRLIQFLRWGTLGALGKE